MAGITRRLAQFVAGLSPEALPLEVIARTRLLVMDLVGIMLRARFDADSTPSLLRAAAELGLAQGAAPVVGEAGGYAPAGAALVNGTLAHSLDFDDTHARASVHPSAPIVPAAFAAAGMSGADGRQLIAGIVAGYETQIRLSLALVPRDHYERGFHPTATCGVFGAAAAAARIFGLDAARTESAFGLCGSLAAGSLQFLADGAWNKRFHVGAAAMNGLIAALMAREGHRGAAEAIEGRHGFLHGYAPHSDSNQVVDGLGSRWETMAIGWKPYPCCRYSHAPIDALLALRAEHAIAPAEIEAVEIGVSRTGWTIIGDPEDAKRRPKNAVDGQFSMSFCAAVVLRDGEFTWASYARHLADPQTLALARRVRCAPDPRPEAEFPRNMSGVARVQTRRGEFERFVVVPKGEPDNFPSVAEMRAKFEGLAGPWLEREQIEPLEGALLALDSLRDPDEVLRLTVPAAAAVRRAAASRMGAA